MEEHVLCQGGRVYCSMSLTCNSLATAVPITVTSQQLLDANGGKLVVTEKDNTFLNMNFGICNDPKFVPPAPKPPCMANVQWQNIHPEVFVTGTGLRILTENSFAICNVCSIPGIIKVAFHGQVATVTLDAMAEASREVMAALNPVAKPIDLLRRKDDKITITAS